MITIIGLGNPGEKYKDTRHNVGFGVVDAFAGKNNFPDFAFSKKFNALLSEEKEVILSKPQTFMNKSGESVKSLVGFYKIPFSNIIIIHDDIDLPVGEIKISKGRGSAGHKGVESIIKKLGTNDFIRLRIGILPKAGKPKNPEDFVIKGFRKEEKDIMEKTIEKAVNALDLLIEQGVEKAMNEYNK